LTLLASPSVAAAMAADVDVQAGPVAVAVGLREAGQTGVDAAHHLAARLDRIERLARQRGRAHQAQG
jgi:hypothetical protein